MSDATSDFGRQWSAATEQYVALARSLWEAAAKAQAAPDPASKARAFNDALARLQQDLQSAWLSKIGRAHV